MSTISATAKPTVADQADETVRLCLLDRDRGHETQGPEPYDLWEAEGGALPRPVSDPTAPARLAYSWSK